MGKCVSFQCIKDLAKVLEESKDNNKAVKDDVLGIFDKICDGITAAKMNAVGRTIALDAAKELNREFGLSIRFLGRCYGPLGTWVSNYIQQRLTNAANVKTEYCQALRDPRTMPLFNNDATALGCLAALAPWIAPRDCKELPMNYTKDENITADLNGVIKLSDTYTKSVGIFCNGLFLEIDQRESKEECDGSLKIRLYYITIGKDGNSSYELIKEYDKITWTNQQDGIAKLNTFIIELKKDVTKEVTDSFETVKKILQLAVKNRAQFMTNFEEAIKSGKNLADGGIRRVIVHAWLNTVQEFWKAGGKSTCDAEVQKYITNFYANEPGWECIQKLFAENVPCPDKAVMPKSSVYVLKSTDSRAAAFVPSLQKIAANVDAATAFLKKLDDAQYPPGQQCDDVFIEEVIKAPAQVEGEDPPAIPNWAAVAGCGPGDVAIIYRYCPAMIWSQTAPVGCERAKVYALMYRLTDMLNATRLPSSYSPLWPTVKNWMPTQKDEDHTIGHPTSQGAYCYYYWPMTKGDVPIGPGDGGVPAPNTVPDQCFIYPRVFTTQDVYKFVIDAWIIHSFLENTTYDGKTWDDKYRNAIEPKLDALKKKIDEACS